MTDQLQRQININIQLRRQLEQCRKDTVEYCAKFCEDHEMGFDRGNYVCMPSPRGDASYTHPGDSYAKALREIIGK